uniref:Uncharacterized protein n=1 Tax=Coturnix japonica TaxID=93934 RepID=A0A8C2UBD6_COTJA
PNLVFVNCMYLLFTRKLKAGLSQLLRRLSPPDRLSPGVLVLPQATFQLCSRSAADATPRRGQGDMNNYKR